MDHRQHLFDKAIKEAYFVETHLLKVIPQFIASSENTSVIGALQDHLDETKEHVARLEKIFDLNNVHLASSASFPFMGLVEDRKRFFHEDHSHEAKEFFNLTAAVKTEHMEISMYEGLIVLARSLGMSEEVSLLKMSLREEEHALRKMLSLTKSYDLSRLNENLLIMR